MTNIEHNPSETKFGQTNAALVSAVGSVSRPG